MAQNLASMTLEETRMAMFSCTPSQLKSLCVGIREFISNKNTPEFQIHDLVRKESIIQKELMRRKILTKGNRQEFDNWLNGVRTKYQF